MFVYNVVITCYPKILMVYAVVLCFVVLSSRHACENIWVHVECSKHSHMLARNTRSHTHRNTMIMLKGSTRSCPKIVAMSCQWTSSRCDYKILFVSDSMTYSPVVINVNVDRFS